MDFGVSLEDISDFSSVYFKLSFDNTLKSYEIIESCFEINY